MNDADLFAAPVPADVSFDEMLACVDRELKMRAKVYPRWVADGKLPKRNADLEILRLRAVRLRLLTAEAWNVVLIEMMAGPALAAEEENGLHDKAAARLDALLQRYPEVPS